MNGPVSWEEFHNEAVEVAKAEPLVASFLNQIIIQSPCWKEAISRLLARSFVGIIDETTWYRIFFDVFNGRYGQYEGENVCDMMVIDLKVCFFFSFWWVIFIIYFSSPGYSRS